MKRRGFLNALLVGLAVAVAPASGRADAPAGALRGFDAYVQRVEQAIQRQHRGEFIAGGQAVREKARRGETVVEEQGHDAAKDVEDGRIHHWRATAFARGASAAEAERLLRDVPAYPRVYAPAVERAAAKPVGRDRLAVAMRVREKYVITVVMDTDYDVVFGRNDARHGYSESRSTRIEEIADAGTAKEHALKGDDEHGFLWRQVTLWSWEERDGGVYLQVESVSLTDRVPRGLGWAVGPLVERVPKEQLEFTLKATCNALRK